jgi:mycothiol synthase
MLPPTSALPLRPVPPGFATRPASLADLDAVAELFAAAAMERHGRVRVRAEDLRVRWLALDALDETVLVERPGGEPPLAAYAELQVDIDPLGGEVEVHTEGRVHPAWTGHGLASFLLDHAEDRAREAAGAVGRSRVTLRTTVVDGDDRARAFLTGRGFAPLRHLLDLRLDLHAAPPAPSWPSGIVCRPFELGRDEEAVWRVHQAAFAELATHLPIPLEDWLDDRIRRDPLFDPGLVLLAEHDHQPVAVAVCRSGAQGAPEDGWVRDLAVLPAWRRKGIGMALLREAFGAFRRRGLTGVALEVDDVSLEGAVALYRRAGMRIVHRTDVLERVLEVAPDAAPTSPASLDELLASPHAGDEEDPSG